MISIASLSSLFLIEGFFCFCFIVLELDEAWCSSEVGCFADWSNLRWSLSLQSSPVADLVVRNALIYTSDAALPFADSMAVSNGRILRVGNYSSVVQVARPFFGLSSSSCLVFIVRSLCAIKV